MANLKKHKYSLQFVEYLISGGAYFWSGSLLLDYVYYSLHWSLWWATMAGNLFGWSVNFILQRYWVFTSKSLRGHLTQVTGRYLFITLVDFGLNYLILYQLKKWGITPAIGQFISAGLFTPWNYLWYRFWVFPEKFDKLKMPHHGLFRVFAHRAHGHSAYHTTS